MQLIRRSEPSTELMVRNTEENLGEGKFDSPLTKNAHHMEIMHKIEFTNCGFRIPAKASSQQSSRSDTTTGRFQQQETDDSDDVCFGLSFSENHVQRDRFNALASSSRKHSLISPNSPPPGRCDRKHEMVPKRKVMVER